MAKKSLIVDCVVFETIGTGQNEQSYMCTHNIGSSEVVEPVKGRLRTLKFAVYAAWAAMRLGKLHRMRIQQTNQLSVRFALVVVRRIRNGVVWGTRSWGAGSLE